MKKINAFSGFTLIELLVVIAIIGILSSVVLSSINSAREKARDTVRKSDLRQISVALQMYYLDKNNWMQTGSGCGSSGNGNGWFNLDYDGSSTTLKSMAQCLIDGGYTSSEIIDPTKAVSGSTPTSGFAYMKYTCV